MPILPFFIGSPMRAIITSSMATALPFALMWGTGATILYKWEKKDNSILRINLDEVRNLRLAEKQGYENAKKEAERIARADKERIEAQYQAKLERAENDLSKSRNAARRASDAYALANSVRGPCPRTAADSVRSGGTDLPTGPDATVIVDGQRCYTGMVAVSRPDFDTLVDNTIRLVNAREWALDTMK